MNILISITVLGLLIFFHETGHFLAATCQGIKVSGFSIGFGPSIIKKEFRGITYSIRALPLGGFVSFPDEEEENGISNDDPDLMRNRSIPQRALVISAGVIANLLLAWLVLIGQATFIGLPNQPEPGVIVISTKQTEPAEQSGLMSGDEIISVDGIKLGRGKEAVHTLVQKIKQSPNKAIKLERIQNNEIEIINITPKETNKEGKIGAQLQPHLNGSIRKAKNFTEVLKQSSVQFIDILIRTIKGYQGLITDFNTTSKQLSGPVKIVEIGANLSKQGGSGLILFAAIISINLAVLNSLPFPLLDGGQLVLLLLEGFRGKPIPEKIQITFMQSGFIILAGLSVVLIIRDTLQLSIFQQIFKH
tara:strand:- start:566 stop:1648 length:1083 start_codon:yes stop_codon:yes gene_type:complete